MPSVGADDQIGANFQFALWSFCVHAGHALLFEDEIDDFVLHQN